MPRHFLGRLFNLFIARLISFWVMLVKSLPFGKVLANETISILIQGRVPKKSKGAQSKTSALSLLSHLFVLSKFLSIV